MSNKIIVVLDANNSANQNLETFLIANILEKKYNKLSIIDLNNINKQTSLVNLDDCKEKDEICSIKLFDRSTYIFPANVSLNGSKLFNFAKSLAAKNDILLINTSQTNFNFNSDFFDLASDLIIFADINKDAPSTLVKLFISKDLLDKNITVYLYNYDDNIENKKKYLSLISRFRSNKIKFDTIKNIDGFNTIKKIVDIDPWQDIYKKINGAF